LHYYGFTTGHPAEGEGPAQTYERLLDLIACADREGMDGWFLAEHHSPFFMPSPNLILAIACRNTYRLRLGITVTVLPYHHPLRVAEEIRMLDNLSAGRLEVGFGRSAVKADQVAYGVDRLTTTERLEATMDVVLKLLTDGEASYESEWWTGSVKGLAPAAVQLPHPPVWVSAVSSGSIARAARVGADLATLYLSTGLAADYRQEYHEQWRAARPDRPVGRFAKSVLLAVAETRQEAEDQARGVIANQTERLAKAVSGLQNLRSAADDPAYAGRERGILDFVSVADDFDQLVERGFVIFGSPDDAVEQMAPIVDAGFEVLTVSPCFGLDHAFERRSVELFMTEVIPRVDPVRSRAELTAGAAAEATASPVSEL
jgi:alkanesulfonate monooxygenase SsuD/methylene tetrahydromethanopterin reductase-like flavin-dependent oxidoreductase (luciferase family)